MDKYITRIKFNDKGKIECCSQTMCVGCEFTDECEEIDVFIKSAYECIGECMGERKYKRVKGRIKAKGNI